MPKQQFALEKGGPKRLEISWGAFWKNTTVTLDGNVIGTIPERESLRAGQEFTLPDGSTLRVQLVQKVSSAGLHVLRNGQPLPGSASDPEARLKGSAIAVFVVGGLNALLGLLGLFTESEFLQMMGVGLFTLIFGIVFLVLGFFVLRRSLVALIAAIIIFALDAILGLYYIIDAGASPGFAWIIFRVLLLIAMGLGIPAIRELKERSTP